MIIEITYNKNKLKVRLDKISCHVFKNNCDLNAPYIFKSYNSQWQLIPCCKYAICIYMSTIVSLCYVVLLEELA